MTSPVPTPTLPQCVVNCAVYRNGVRSDIGLDNISDALAIDDGSFVWVGLYEPEETLLDKLQEEFGLHDLAIEDAQHAHQRPKIEAYGNSLFLAVHTAQLLDGHVRFGETHAFVGPRFLITVRHGASLSYRHVRARFEREPELLSPGIRAVWHSRFRRRQLPADRQRIPRRAQRSGTRHLRGGISPRHHRQAL
jgi:magnesium transporter